MQGGFPGIDKQAATTHAFIVSLAHCWRIGADQIDVDAGLKPCALNDRGFTAYRRANQVGLSRTGLDLTDWRERDLREFLYKTRTQGCCLVTRPVPDLHLF